MNRFFDQKKIINILFISAVAILLINLLLDKIFFNNNQDNIELTSTEIDSTFRTALLNLGIKEEWIKTREGKYPVNLSVSVPKDLPIVLILQEMNNVFDTNEVKVNSLEKKIGGNAAINLISGGETKLTAQLSYSSKILRKTARVGFIVYRFSNDNDSDSLLLEYPEQFAFLLIPSKASKEGVKKILKYDKEYIVNLNDEIVELEFKLNDNYSIVRLKNSIREIVGTFPQAVFFMIDNQSSLYKSKVYPLLKEEIEKRKIRLIEESYFKSMSESKSENRAETFNHALDKMNAGEDKVFLISAEDFLALNSEIMKYRKLGYRFTNPSALLF